ncbi:hypothetical protein DFP72DRAFT_873935 [Ephemerocybe angulata]|uniref:Uncharacterized protein n=1 Tax=Ephemerocybe angulata TaxID=980116 RepID=A0A8H6IH04_9AGAR|nr:hypothetical protein DFP72DRAFT_873935 [Tulosesus angulatus]
MTLPRRSLVYIVCTLYPCIALLRRRLLRFPVGLDADTSYPLPRIPSSPATVRQLEIEVPLGKEKYAYGPSGWSLKVITGLSSSLRIEQNVVATVVSTTFKFWVCCNLTVYRVSAWCCTISESPPKSCCSCLRFCVALDIRSIGWLVGVDARPEASS